jgi:Tfp pilus assembly protein FimT
MKRPRKLNSRDGFATVDMMIVAVIILIVVTYAWTAIIQAQRWQAREGAAQQFAGFLERARSDSVRRRATDAQQMAEVTILNDTFYEVRTDENGDGALDAPRVISLQEQQLKMDGPFPRMFMFDRFGKYVDGGGNALKPTYVTFGNRSGKSVVTISDTGKASWNENGNKK